MLFIYVLAFLLFFFLIILRTTRSTRTVTLFPYTTLFRSHLKDLYRLVPSKQSVVFVPDAEAIEIGAQRILVRGGIWDGVNCIHALARDSPIYGDLLRFVRMIGFDP